MNTNHFAQYLLGSVLLIFPGLIMAETIDGHEWHAGHEKWAVCKTNSDCIVMDVPCGPPQAINKWFQKDYEDWWAKKVAGQLIDCARLSKETFAAACKSGSCVSMRRRVPG